MLEEGKWWFLFALERDVQVNAPDNADYGEIPEFLFAEVRDVQGNLIPVIRPVASAVAEQIHTSRDANTKSGAVIGQD